MGVLVAPVEARREGVLVQAAREIGERGFVFAVVSAATMLAVAIAGYHPYAEDGGIYAAGVKRLLDAGLYPHDAAFAMEPMRWSLFAPTVAGLVRVTHVPLPWMLLALHVGSLWVTLAAVWMLAARCFERWEARAGAVVLLACWLGLPVAGTALYVMDPYLTARSFATPAMVFAIVGVLDATGLSDGRVRRSGWAMWMGGLAACAAVHPLTAVYAGFATAMLACMRARSHVARVRGVVGLCVAVVPGALCARMFAPAESAAYLNAALSRSYWFLSEWRWYEIAGLVAPLGILGAAGYFSKRESGWAEQSETLARRSLARMGVVAGVVACMIAMVFAREGAVTHLVARVQPLRMFQIVYVVMVVMLGGWLGERVLRRSAWRWAAAVLLLGGVMFGAARAEYPASIHLEMPWAAPKNAWVQAFEWVRANTPKNALFAMDGDYIHAPGEDAENFRAIAERSVLPDFSKDGGEASIAPDLAEAWGQGMTTQQGLSAASDMERIERLRPLGVTWVVLSASATTGFDCPYVNASVRVCPLR